MSVFLCIRKVYVLSRSPSEDSYSKWMIFDVDTQNWMVFTNDLDFVTNCCLGSMLTIRNVHYYFNNDITGVEIPWLNKPIYRILDNGTSIDLKISDIPFAKELEAAREKSQANPNGEGYGFLSIELAPFYQRFYEDVPK